MSFYSNLNDEKVFHVIGEKSLKFINEQHQEVKNRFHQKLNVEMKSANRLNKFMEMPIEKSCYLVTVQDVGPLQSIENEFLVLEQCGFVRTIDSPTLTTNEPFIAKSREKYFPLGGIAFNINYLKVKTRNIKKMKRYFFY